mmetsp:Transcript_23125/g.44901  ORF Transcript_23125/g.44901 Transcript_23125/m.44901 type:complete len:299 (-) Transcript_23125:87-983(-)
MTDSRTWSSTLPMYRLTCSSCSAVKRQHRMKCVLVACWKKDAAADAGGGGGGGGWLRPPLRGVCAFPLLGAGGGLARLVLVHGPQDGSRQEDEDGHRRVSHEQILARDARTIRDVEDLKVERRHVDAHVEDGDDGAGKLGKEVRQMHHRQHHGKPPDRQQHVPDGEVVKGVGADGEKSTAAPKEKRSHHAAHSGAEAVQHDARGPHAEAEGGRGHAVDLPQPLRLVVAGPHPPRTPVGKDALLFKHQLERRPSKDDPAGEDALQRGDGDEAEAGAAGGQALLLGAAALHGSSPAYRAF